MGKQKTEYRFDHMIDIIANPRNYMTIDERLYVLSCMANEIRYRHDMPLIKKNRILARLYDLQKSAKVF